LHPIAVELAKTRSLRFSAANIIARDLALITYLVSLSACQTLNWETIFTRPPAGKTPITGQVQEPIISDQFDLPLHSNMVGQIQVVHADYEDTLFTIARYFDLGIDEMTAANPDVDRWLPGQDTPIVLPTRFVLPQTPQKGLVLNIANKRLFYYPEPQPNEPLQVATYPIGIGRVGWETPTGNTKVISKIINPNWYVPPTVREEHAAKGDPLPAVVPPGPDNPLGDYALQLGMPSYLIHGTNKPAGVGMRISHGCVRLYPEDIELLFNRVPIGAPVTIVNQPYLVGWSEGNIFLEAHKPLEDDKRELRVKLEMHVKDAVRENGISDKAVDWNKVAQVIKEARGFPIPILKGSADTETLLLTARLIKRSATINTENKNNSDLGA
jgi:L,D-transpeptidase ErfK/SrfK